MTTSTMPPAHPGMTGLHAEFDRLLASHVHGQVVDYAGLLHEREALQGYLQQLKTVHEQGLGGLADQLAFWINAHNAIVLHAVLQHAPLRSPKDLPGFFSERTYEVAGRALTIRRIGWQARRLGEYRVLLTLTPATRGAPALRPEAYDPARLSGQIQSQAREFLSDPEHGFRIDQAEGEVWLSKVFHWSSSDLMRVRLPYYVVAPFAAGPILRAIYPDLPYETQQALHGRTWRVRYLPYDWRLNAVERG